MIRDDSLPEREHGFIYFCHDMGWIFLGLYSQVPPKHRAGQGKAVSEHIRIESRHLIFMVNCVTEHLHDRSEGNRIVRSVPCICTDTHKHTSHPMHVAHLLRLAGKSLWSTAAAGRPPGPNMPPSAFPKSSRTEAEGDVPSPRILGEDPAAGGVLEQSCAANTTSAMRCLCLLASRRSSYATLSSCIMTDMGPLLVLLCTTASDTASAVTPLMGSWHTERGRGREREERWWVRETETLRLAIERS